LALNAITLTFIGFFGIVEPQLFLMFDLYRHADYFTISQKRKENHHEKIA